MRSTSAAFDEAVARNTRVLLKATLGLADGTVLELTGADFVLGGLSVTQSSSSSGSFDIGAAVVGTCDATLANYDGKFDPYDFTGATLVPYVGKELDGGGVEWLRMGTFNAEQPDSYGSTIRLKCRDNLTLMDVPYSGVNTYYPATLRTIAREACLACNLELASIDFPNAGYVVSTRPESQGLSCLKVLGYVAQVAGCFVTCDDMGRPKLTWYDTSTFENEGWSDGGSFGGELTPYEDGDVADGGWFMGGGDSLDGGALTGGAGHVHLSAISSLTVSTDDVVITGVEVTAANEQTADGTIGADGESATYGETGYVLKVMDNPLICYGQAQAVAQQIGPSIVGMRFRPLQASGIASPAWQAGDALVVTDQRSRTFRSWITNITFKAGGYANVKCDAATPARNSAESGASRTLSVVEGRKLVRAEKTAREIAVRNFAELVATSSGLYMTSEPQPDGSTIYYAHDKRTLAESTVVWKFTANAFAVSTDGGETYPYGLDATGNAILQRIYAIGLDASYIDTGRLTVGPASNPILVVDVDTGEVRINQSAYMGGRTVQQVLTTVDATITQVDVQYAQNQSSTTAPSTGWSTTAPTWRDGYYIWQRTATTTASGTTYSTPTCISGREGHDGTSVTILGSYETLAQLKADHPTGNAGDAYMVAGDLYVWNGSAWEDVGQIQGPQGEPGTPGAPGSSVTVSKVEYGLSDSASTQPSSWSQTVPTSITKGQWLWCKTTYSDSKTATTKTYVGLDGDPAYSYSVLANPSTLARASNGALTPSSIVFSAWRTIGSGDPSSYAGRFRIDEHDGSSWTQKYVSSSDEVNKSYTPTSTAKSIRCILYQAGGTSKNLDTQTVPVLQDGATGAAGADAYTVLLTNESHTFPAGVNAATASSTNCSVIAYKGTSRIAATIGSITGAPTGMSTTTYSNGTTSAYFKVSVTSSLTTRSGVLSVPVTVDGKSFTLTFSWSLALKGDVGQTGNGASEIEEQYYLSTSSTTQTGGSWSTTQPAWSSGKYIWTRSKITWTDGSTTYTSAVLAKAVNGANQSASTAQTAADNAQTAADNAQDAADAAATAASNAAKVATNYLDYSSSTGLDVGYSGTSAKTRINGSGLEVFDGDGKSALFAGLQSGKSLVRVGRATGSGNIVMSEDGYIDLRYASSILAHFGYGEGVDSIGGTTIAPYYTIGKRKASSGIGNYSVAEGINTIASWYAAHAEGQNTTASSNSAHAEGYSTIARSPYSHAEGHSTTAGPSTFSSGSGYHGQHAEGSNTTATGEASHAEGLYTNASGLASHAEGSHTIAADEAQSALGCYNVQHSITSFDNRRLFLLGGGTSSLRKTVAYITTKGAMWIAGTLTQASDRRLKEHHAYLGEDAAAFVRKLRPALFTKDGERHLGFYAQDVQEADAWDTATVTETEAVDESLDFNPLQLDYTALIAPLVAYAQQLEKRIDQQQAQMDALAARLDALERR